MASQVTNYKCPACTGPLHFVGASGQLECDFCGSKYDVAQIEALYADKEAAAAAASEAAEAKAESDRQKVAEMEAQGWDTSDLTSDWGAEADGMKAYSCPSCGAELICDASTAATSCPYCGNPTVVPGQFSGALKPDFVHLEKSAVTGICSPSCSPTTAKTPAKVHLRLRFQNPGKPRTAGLCGRAAGACDCGPLSCAKIERPSPLEKPSCKVRLFAQNRSREYRQKVTGTTLFQTAFHRIFQPLAQTAHVRFHG